MKPVYWSSILIRGAALFSLLAGLFCPGLAVAQAAPVAQAVELAAPQAAAALRADVISAAWAVTTTVTCATPYIVKTGDTLTRIGVQYGVKWPDIAKANNLANPSLIYVGQSLCIPGATATPVVTTTVTTAPTGIPLINITGVVTDKSVTLTASGFPANQKIDVRMGKYGTLGVGGTLVTTIDSGTGSFTGTYTVPAELKGQDTIAIRLESRWGGYYSYNWFYNNSTK